MERKHLESKFLKTQMRKEGKRETNEELNKIKNEMEEKVILTARYPKKNTFDWKSNGYQGKDMKKKKEKENKWSGDWQRIFNICINGVPEE